MREEATNTVTSTKQTAKRCGKPKVLSSGLPLACVLSFGSQHNWSALDTVHAVFVVHLALYIIHINRRIQKPRKNLVKTEGQWRQSAVEVEATG